jgi:hypothetical protein
LAGARAGSRLAVSSASVGCVGLFAASVCLVGRPELVARILAVAAPTTAGCGLLAGLMVRSRWRARV